ncbi:MAG: AraC family transcriptional regulator [Gammaproteobacteria bacterium]
MPLELPIEVGHEYIKIAKEHPRVSHTEHVIAFTISGRMKMFCNTDLQITPDSIVLMPAGMPHVSKGGENLEFKWVSFCSSCLDLPENHPLMMPFDAIHQGAIPCASLTEIQKKRIEYLFDELQSEIKHSKKETPIVMKSLLILLLKEINQVMKNNMNTCESSSLVAKVLSYINQNSFKPISLKDVAIAVNYAPAYVTTTLKKETGYTVGEWIIRNRLSESCGRLAHTDTPINIIAMDIGWSDVSNFIRQFKKAYGVTPSAWRKKRKHQNISNDDPMEKLSENE